MTVRVAIVFVLAVHGLIHLMGFAKAFGFAEMPQLVLPISRPLGVAWLAAAVLVLAAAGTYAGGARGFWIVAAAAVIVSQCVIVTSWGDARFGTVANVLLAALALLGFFANGPTSLRAQYERDVAHGLAHAPAAAIVTERDLAPLPAAVQRYLRRTGAVGQPRVWNFRTHFRGRIRGGPDAPWMPLDAEQTSFAQPAARLFFLHASRAGVPLVGLHRYVGSTATMRIQLAGAIPVVDGRGPMMDRGETVTLFNDMCLIAPATLLGPGIVWGEAGPDTVGATFTNAGHTIRASLVFDAAGDLVDFVSDDRSAASADGKSFTTMRWTTPVRTYRDFGPHRLFARAEARWHTSAGEYAYIELEMTDVEYNIAAPGGRRSR